MHRDISWMIFIGRGPLGRGGEEGRCVVIEGEIRGMEWEEDSKERTRGRDRGEGARRGDRDEKDPILD